MDAILNDDKSADDILEEQKKITPKSNLPSYTPKPQPIPQPTNVNAESKSNYCGFGLKPKQKEKPNLSTYDLLLQDERWHNKRNTILERDKHRCVKCGKTTTLQVHHKYYNKYPDGKKVNPWDYPNDALITLCDECHKEVHKTKKIKTYYRSKKDKYS